MRLGALQGLSKCGLAEALPLLAARVPYGGEAQELIRADVISAYGAYVAAFGERADVQRATERLLDAMRTHADNCLGRASVNAVHFAARALVALRAQHASGAIAAAKSGLAFQYHAALDTELINLRCAGPAAQDLTVMIPANAVCVQKGDGRQCDGADEARGGARGAPPHPRGAQDSKLRSHIAWPFLRPLPVPITNVMKFV